MPGTVKQPDRSQAKSQLKPLPTGVFVTFVGGVCLALAVSGFYSFTMLFRLESAYLENKARETAALLDIQSRGPGRRNNPEVWRHLLTEMLATKRDSLVFLVLVDGNGTTLAQAGATDAQGGAAKTGTTDANGRRVFEYESPLVAARLGNMMGPAQIAGWRLRIGVSAAEADFIRRQAWVQLVVTAIAITTLALLSAYLMRALRHYLAYQLRENSERHLKALGTMAATLAHEIRNPLGAMKGLTQLAQEELPGDHRTQGLMNTVVGEAQRLERLVTDLLTFARLPQPREQVVDVDALLETLRTLVDARLSAAKVSLEASVAAGLDGVRSDPELLTQLLINIVLNGIDASPAGGVVGVRATMDERRRQLRFEVTDSGPGFPPGDKEVFFQPFHTGKTHGTGLGLTVSRQIAESLGGTVELSNRPEGGALCLIRIPSGRS